MNTTSKVLAKFPFASILNIKLYGFYNKKEEILKIQ